MCLNVYVCESTYSAIPVQDYDYPRRIPNYRSRDLRPSEIDDDTDEGWFAYNIKGLMAQTKYAIRVRTKNEAGWSPHSHVFEFTTSLIGKGGCDWCTLYRTGLGSLEAAKCIWHGSESINLSLNESSLEDAWVGYHIVMYKSFRGQKRGIFCFSLEKKQPYFCWEGDGKKEEGLPNLLRTWRQPRASWLQMECFSPNQLKSTTRGRTVGALKAWHYPQKPSWALQRGTWFDAMGVGFRRLEQLSGKAPKEI